MNLCGSGFAMQNLNMQTHNQAFCQLKDMNNTWTNLGEIGSEHAIKK